MKSLAYLGHIISLKCVKPDRYKISAIPNFQYFFIPIPTVDNKYNYSTKSFPDATRESVPKYSLATLNDGRHFYLRARQPEI